MTSYKGSEKLYKEACSADKELKLYDGVRLPLHFTSIEPHHVQPVGSSNFEILIVVLLQYEHILLRKGCDEADDVRRQAVMSDILDWLSRR